jgi:hypothetical protein
MDRINFCEMARFRLNESVATSAKVDDWAMAPLSEAE